VIGRGAAVVSAAVLFTAGLAFAVSGGAGASSVEKSFDSEGEHQWTVPEGVCAVWIDAFGGQGGSAEDTDPDEGEAGGTNPGGLGGEAKAKIAVTPGEILDVNVGGRGEDAVDEFPGEGGENGGGDGGAATRPEDDEAGAGGGGASDVRQGGTTLDHRVVVAGGGGGAGGGFAEGTVGASAGGDGGGEEGDDGQPSDGAAATQAGEGGSQSEGGDGGVVDPPPSNRNGDDGEKGDGGDGGGPDPQGFVGDGGGGGGGGLYGGGGGASSRSDEADDFRDGAGGGGGSGFGPDDTKFDSGEQEGDGEVTISYDPVTDACTTAIEVEPKFTG
jgi:hypothetical protein